MKEEEKNFFYKGNYTIFSNKNLNGNDKIIYTVIDSLTKQEGFCWASNEKIAELTGNSTKTVQRSIYKLLTKNYISKWKQKKGKKVYRFITTNTEIFKSNNNLKALLDKSKKIDLIDYDWLNGEE